jgi:hypothetical protein
VNHPHQPVRLILDKTALLAYLAGVVHASEPVHEVAADGVMFGIPSVTIAETLTEVTDPFDRQLLFGLLAHPSCQPLDTPGDGWHELAFWRQITGRLDLAVCAVAAVEHDAAILTCEGKLYGDHLPVIDIPEA